MSGRHRLGSVLLFSTSLALSTQFGGIACSDDDPAEPDPTFPGEAPPPASMQIDLSDFSGGVPVVSGPCHAGAVALVSIANAVVAIALATPSAVLAATVQGEPAYVGNQTWRWTASGGTGSNAWSSEFDGRIANAATIEWTMRVSGTPLGLDDFVWYVGSSAVTGQAGTWRFYDPLDPDEIDETMRSEYLVVSEDTATLTFENRNDDDTTGFGDLLTYDAAGDDLTVSFHSAAEMAELTIEWSLATGAGTLTDYQGQTCCWGARPNYDDAQCP